jgi:hypothetical protein
MEMPSACYDTGPDGGTYAVNSRSVLFLLNRRRSAQSRDTLSIAFFAVCWIHRISSCIISSSESAGNAC